MSLSGDTGGRHPQSTRQDSGGSTSGRPKTSLISAAPGRVLAVDEKYGMGKITLPRGMRSSPFLHSAHIPHKASPLPGSRAAPMCPSLSRVPQEGSETRSSDSGSLRWTPLSAETLQGGRIQPSFWKGAEATPHEETSHLGLHRLQRLRESRGLKRNGALNVIKQITWWTQQRPDDQKT